jgi:hypothetical protein
VKIDPRKKLEGPKEVKEVKRGVLKKRNEWYI